MSENIQRPLDRARIEGYDLARAAAILGMVVVHFGLVMAADATRPAWASMVLEVLDGRAAATFVILAGVGLTLRWRGATANSDLAAAARARRSLIRRGLLLLIAGFVNLMVWPGDILCVYGVSLLLAPWLLSGSPGRPLWAALAFVAGFMVLMVTLDYGKNWDFATMTYRRLWTPEGLIRNLFFDGFRSIFPWTGLMAFGIWLGGHDLRNRATNSRIALAGLAAILMAELASWWALRQFAMHPRGLDHETIDALFGTRSMPPLPLFLLSAAGTATLVIAVCVRLAEHEPARRWCRPFVATGQMALTWYCVHIWLGLGSVVGLGLESSRSLPWAEGCGLLFFAAAVLFSWVWKARFRYGPLEAMLRAVGG